MNNTIEENCEVNKNTNTNYLKKKWKFTKNQEEMSNILGDIKMQTKTIMEYDLSPCKLQIAKVQREN